MCDEVWTSVEQCFEMVETGTSADGVSQLTTNLKGHKDRLNNCLVKFTQLLELLGLIVDKHEAFSSSLRRASGKVADLEKRRTVAAKVNPGSKQDFLDILDQLKVFYCTSNFSCNFHLMLGNCLILIYLLFSP